MKTKFAAAFVAAVTLLGPAIAQTPADRKPVVVVISLDAFGASLLADPKLPVPTLHALMKSGAYATSMQPVNPTITWPNHTAMVTGVTPAKHGLIANGLIVDQRTGKIPHVEFHADKTQLVRVPTVYDEAHDAGMVTAEMDWVAVEHASSIDWSFFEQPEATAATSPLLKEMIADGSLSADELRDFNHGPSQPYRDQLYTRGAIYAIKHHHPNLVLLHLLSLDGNEHTYGYGTPAGAVTAAFLDGQVKDVVDAVREAGDMDRTTFLIVSDHGQSNVHHTVNPNAILTAAGITQDQATALAEGGVAYIYEAPFANPVLDAKVRAAFTANPATDSIPTRAEAIAHGWPTMPLKYAGNAQDIKLTAPDVLVYAKEDWKFAERVPTQPEAQTGAHGYPNTRPLMQSIFIASGAAIKPVGQQPAFPNLDIAATIAQILSLPQTGMDGKPLTAILK